MIKKIIATITALMLAAAMLSSCGNNDSSQSEAESAASSSAADSAESSETSAADSAESTAGSGTDESTAEVTLPEPSLTIDGEKVDTSNIVMCTVDGNDIDFNMYRYYYYYVMTNMGLTAETIASDEEAFNTLKANVITQFKRDYTTVHLANENSITLLMSLRRTLKIRSARSKPTMKTMLPSRML